MNGSTRSNRFTLACRTPWVWELWDRVELPGEWQCIHEPAGLTLEAIRAHDPRYIFFPHWSERVPREIYENWECVCFHAAPVPYGRGGSPVQNMIVRGHESSELVALRMIEELDAGPVYLRRPLSLLGGGDEIYLRIAELSIEMIREIIESEPDPTPQSGDPVVFRRKTPEESALPSDASLEELFDFIRMLDADGYPSAFVDHGRFRLEFERPTLRRGRLEASVTIKRRSESDAN